MSQIKLEEILLTLTDDRIDECCKQFKDAHSAILELFKSAVPEEHSGTRDYATAWNNCRTETLRNMNEL